MELKLGTYAGQEVDTSDFSLYKYIEENCFSNTRLYLLIKKKTTRQKLFELSSFVPDDSDSDCDIYTECQSTPLQKKKID